MLLIGVELLPSLLLPMMTLEDVVNDDDDGEFRDIVVVEMFDKFVTMPDEKKRVEGKKKRKKKSY